MHLMSRRNFLKLGASSLAVLAGTSVSWLRHPVLAADKGTEFLMFCDTDVNVEITPDTPATDPGTVKVVNMASGETFAIDIPFFGHTVIQNPALPHQVVTFEKWGKRGALIDIHERKILVNATTVPGYTFFGHAAFTHDGTLFVTSEDSYDKNDGRLTVRDSKTLEVVRSYSSHGTGPHECRLLKDGKTILVANQQATIPDSRPSLAWIDFETGKLIDRKEYDLEVPPGQFDGALRGAAGHFDVSYDNWICCGGSAEGMTPDHKGTPRRGFVFFVSPEGKFFYPTLEPAVTKHMLGEGLSVSMLGQTGLVAVTMSHGGACLVFDYKTQKLVQNILEPHVKGVVPLEDTADAGNGVLMLGSRRLGKALLHLDGKPQVSKFRDDVSGKGAHLARMYI